MYMPLIYSIKTCLGKAWSVVSKLYSTYRYPFYDRQITIMKKISKVIEKYEYREVTRSMSLMPTSYCSIEK